MGFDAITAWSIQLESSHRAGSNGIEHIAIEPKLKNPRPLSLSPHHFDFGGGNAWLEESAFSVQRTTADTNVAVIGVVVR
jgi:hypothetical protein